MAVGDDVVVEGGLVPARGAGREDVWTWLVDAEIEIDEGGLVFEGGRRWDLRAGRFATAVAGTGGLSVRRGASGLVEVWRGEARLAVIVPTSGARAIAFLDDGRVDHLGEGGRAPDQLVCLGDDVMLPYPLCEHRWREDGALARRLADQGPG
ncbi:MAG: hypothetical protein R3B72_28100 [Polyangiaceae bacterium]